MSYNLARQLVQRGHSVTVYTSYSNQTDTQGYVDGIFVKRFRRVWIGRWWPDQAMPTMALDLIRNRFDFVHSFDIENFQSLLTSALARFSNESLIVNATLHPIYRTYKETAGRFVLDSADAIIVQCEQEKQSLPSYVDRKRVFVVPCGIDSRMFSRMPDSNLFREKYSISTTDRVVLYVGPVGGRKAVSSLVRIMPRVVRAVERSRLVVIARGSDFDELRKIVTDNGISDRVTFLGRVGDEELLQAYAGSDIFAFPSMHESFGIVLLEAAAAGLPIVSTRVGVAPEIVNDGVNGHLCETCDADFADRVIEVLSQDRYRRTAENLRSEILDRFDWSSAAGFLEKVYSNVGLRNR